MAMALRGSLCGTLPRAVSQQSSQEPAEGTEIEALRMENLALQERARDLEGDLVRAQ
jgi:hypothetical protein